MNIFRGVNENNDLKSIVTLGKTTPVIVNRPLFKLYFVTCRLFNKLLKCNNEVILYFVTCLLCSKTPERF